MQSIHDETLHPDTLGLWFLGQNGFILKSASSPSIAIDPYLTDSCRLKFADSGFDLSRTLPIFLEPEDLDVDLYVVTHSHEDHLDEETVRRLRCSPHFVAPWEAHQRLLSFGIPPERCTLLHPHQTHTFGDVRIQGTFALPTDDTDLNHIGILFEFSNGIRLYNTGDTAYAPALERLLPTGVDLCTICINGGFHNLSHDEAALLIRTIQPRVAIPTHYDMMVCNRSDPEMFRAAIQAEGSQTQVHIMNYEDPFLYRRPA